jgi:hypothetical protein
VEQPQPTGSGELTALAPFAGRLLGVTVLELWQLTTVSSDGSIPLPGTLVLETGIGFITLQYSQDGLSCQGPSNRAEIRWDMEPDLAMGRSGDAEEWLDLTPWEDPSNVPELPLVVESVTGWFGVGSYLETFALILAGADRELVVMTTDEFDLRCAPRQEARQRAELIAANTSMDLVEESRRV